LIKKEFETMVITVNSFCHLSMWQLTGTMLESLAVCLMLISWACVET